MWCNILRRFISSAAVAQRKIPITNEVFNSRFQQQFGSISSQTATQNDVLTTQLTSASTPKRIFELISINIRSMNNEHLIKVLSVLNNVRKMQTTKDILGEPSFRDICSRLLVRARFYDVDESLTVLRYLSAFGVPTESAVFQAYLQMMRHYVNDLTLPQIIFLNFLLQKQSQTKLVLALKKALPMVVENALQDQLPSCNQRQIVQLYLLAAQTRMRESALRTIANYLVESLEPLTAENATFVLWALAKNYFWDDQCTMMAEKSFSALTPSLDELDRKILHFCLGRLNNARLYDERFLETVTKKALSEKWDLPETHNLAGILTYHKHFHPEFLDYYSKQVEESLSAVGKSPVTIPAVIEVFATPGYKPYNWERFKIQLQQLQLSDKMSLFKLATNFAALGDVPDELLRAVFEQGTELCQEIDIEKDKGLKHDLFLLWHMANKDLQISYSQVGNLIMKMNERDFDNEESYNPSLRAALVKSMNGAHFVNTKQNTKSGIVIDHLIVFDTNGNPFAINAGEIISDVCVEDLQLPADFTKVAILEKDCAGYLKNFELPTGKSVLEERVLKKLGFLPIPIKLKSWLEFPEKERIPYVTRAIKLALAVANRPSDFCTSHSETN